MYDFLLVDRASTPIREIITSAQTTTDALGETLRVGGSLRLWKSGKLVCAWFNWQDGLR